MRITQDSPQPLSAILPTGPLNMSQIPSVRISISQTPIKEKKNLSIEKYRYLVTQEIEDGRSPWEIVKQIKTKEPRKLSAEYSYRHQLFVFFLVAWGGDEVSFKEIF